MHLHGGDIYKNKDKIDFSANICMLGTPEAVIQAACEGVRQSMNYPDVNCTGLKQALSQAQGIPVQNIICGNGAAELIFSLVLALKPRKAILPVPSFYEYEQALRNLSDCNIEYEYLKEENGFVLTEEILDKIDEQTDVIFMCNPNNPTGVVTEKELLEKILSKCEQNDVLLILDECFNDMIDSSIDYSMMDKIKESKNIFILKAFTKLYAMAGLRLGYGYCSNDEVLKKMHSVMQPWNVSIPAQLAGIAALKEEKHVQEFKNTLRIERKYLLDELEKYVEKIYASKANYIFFKAEADLYEKCYNNGILIRDCSNYVGLEKGYYRIAVKNREQNQKLIETFSSFH